MKKIIFSIVMLCLFQHAFCQQPAKIKVTLWDGMIVTGYVDDGAFVNFGGPAVKMVCKPVTVLLGMLPSLKIKEDKVAAGAKKNATVTPSLGAGLSIAYKHIILQLPLYYTAKTATTNGKWNMGIGLGYKF